jgi:uncharacterized OB-fold protein
MRPHPSSSEPPRPHLVEQLTRLNLLRSLTSQCCPSCGGFKAPRRTFCWECWGRLPPHTQKECYRSVDDGYDRSVLRAMQHLRKTRFILRDSPECVEMRRLPAKDRFLTVELAAQIVASTVCPRCAGDKLPGAVWCGPCNTRLGDAVAQKKRGAKTGLLYGDSMDAMRQDLDPKLLLSEGHRRRDFCNAVVQAIRLTHGQSIIYRDPNPRPNDAKQ